MVVAIHRRDRADRVTLLDSDRRKCAFLRDTARRLALDVAVIDGRIEDVPGQGAAVLSARALAPLPALLGHAERHLAPAGKAIFPKGRRWQEEVDAARAGWRFALDAVPSRTENGAAILVVGEVSRAIP